MSKPTPGTWRRAICEPGDGEITRIVKNNIAVKAGEDTVVALCGHPDNLEAMANARLIAAVPDLLSDCEFVRQILVELMNRDDLPWEYIDVATIEAAIASFDENIAKAKGDS